MEEEKKQDKPIRKPRSKKNKEVAPQEEIKQQEK